MICLSGRFLKELTELCLKGYNGHSEVTTPTLCKYLGMKYLDIDKSYHSSQLYYRLNSATTDTKIMDLIKTYKQNKQNVLVHPCKF